MNALTPAAGSQISTPSPTPPANASTAPGERSFGIVLASMNRASSREANDTGGASPDASFVTIKRGDTLVGIAARTLAQTGGDTRRAAAVQAALTLARDNGIANPNLIMPGQTISTASIMAARAAGLQAASLPRQDPAAQPTAAAETPHAELASDTTSEPAASLPTRNDSKPLPAPPAAPTRTLASLRTPPRTAPANSAAATSGRVNPNAPTRSPAVARPANPVLERTLERAVKLGYVQPAEKDAVRAKVLQLAGQYQFNPDHLAMVTLMESDGMNPRATNGRCHGLIQFCDGPNRGAAAVGYGKDAQDITQLSALQQLDLVGRYFSQLNQQQPAGARPVSLDQLYLSILYPAARNEPDADAPLGIPGRQALTLYADGDPANSITRRSLLNGLVEHARAKLADIGTNPGVSPVASNLATSYGKR